jgi:putative ABC transport system ATP-binding protein
VPSIDWPWAIILCRFRDRPAETQPRELHRVRGRDELVRELASGGEGLLKTATPGDCFGEMGPVFGLPRSATARARVASTVIGYTVQQFRERLGATGSREIIEHRDLTDEA